MNDENKQTETVESVKIPVPKDKETMGLLLKSGMHFGHRTSKWNPKMKKYIYAERNNIHILDLTKTIDALNAACKFLTIAASQGEVLFVGTKKQSQEIIEKQAKKSGAHYIVRRWPGGLLTNFKVIRNSIERIDSIIESFDRGMENRTKYEMLQERRQLSKLAALYSGVRGMKRYPKAVVVVDARVERIAILEARKMRIPVVAMLDTNADPDCVKYPIPGNDDATKAIELVITVLSDAVALGNKGKGAIHTQIDFEKIDQLIQKKHEEIERRKLEEKTPKEEPRILRVKGRQVKIIKKGK